MSSAISERSDPLVGLSFHDFVIERKLAQGGMGAVYLLRHQHYPIRKVLKVILPLYADHPAIRERFEREALAVASLKHPNIAKIDSVGTINGQPCMLIPFLDGQPLDAYLAARGGPLRAHEVLQVGDGVSGQCVAVMVDAGVDAVPSAPAVSCAALPHTCGTMGNDDCCNSPMVMGGSFFRSFDHPGDSLSGDMTAPATISNFRLDKYEVTVGRFRAFVEGGQGTQLKLQLYRRRHTKLRVYRYPVSRHETEGRWPLGPIRSCWQRHGMGA